MRVGYRWCPECRSHILAVRKVRMIDIVKGKKTFECPVCGKVVGRKPSGGVYAPEALGVLAWLIQTPHI